MTECETKNAIGSQSPLDCASKPHQELKHMKLKQSNLFFRLHYKEYLGTLIYQNKIDPIHIFNEDELELVLRRENIHIPSKIKGENYMEQLKKVRFFC